MGAIKHDNHPRTNVHDDRKRKAAAEAAEAIQRTSTSVAVTKFNTTPIQFDFSHDEELGGLQLLSMAHQICSYHLEHSI
jgi:hypothetical protein